MSIENRAKAIIEGLNTLRKAHQQLRLVRAEFPDQEKLVLVKATAVAGHHLIETRIPAKVLHQAAVNVCNSWYRECLRLGVKVAELEEIFK